MSFWAQRWRIHYRGDDVVMALTGVISFLCWGFTLYPSYRTHRPWGAHTRCFAQRMCREHGCVCQPHLELSFSPRQMPQAMHAPLGLPEASCQSKENLSLSFRNLEIDYIKWRKSSEKQPNFGIVGKRNRIVTCFMVLTWLRLLQASVSTSVTWGRCPGCYLTAL